MRPKRYQLRYFRSAGLSQAVAIHVMLSGEAARNLSYLRLLLFLLLQP